MLYTRPWRFVRIALAAGPANAAFQKLQALAGEWEGKDDQGNAVKTNFKLIAGNTAVMETLNMSGMEEMVTLYSVDGDGIALLHYCPTNNQPHMRALPPSGDIRELVFEFQGAGNLPDLATGHEHKLVMQFQDHEHITEHWTGGRTAKTVKWSTISRGRPGRSRHAGDPLSCRPYGCGVVFSLDLSGKERVLCTFTRGADGAVPYSGLLLYRGSLYGTTSGGGAYSAGVVFKVH